MSARKIWIIAHRGASADAPESTAAALTLAVRQRADMIELDVQLTRDGRVVVFHDDRLERASTGRGRVSNWRYRDLAELDSGAWFSRRFAGQRILTVAEVLKFVPTRVRINLELKRTSRPKALVRQVATSIRAASAVRRVMVSSFEVRLLRLMRQALPSVACAVLCKRDADRAIRQALEMGCVAVNPKRTIATRAMMLRARHAGLRVYVWTVDQVADAKRFVRDGADGIFTNTPGRMRRGLMT